MPKFSITLPTRNQRPFIQQTVDSVLGQTIEDFEFIIVNNGSTDGTAEYLDGLTDPRIKVFHQEERPPGIGRNRALREAKGEFITGIASDDVCAPYFLEALHAPMADDPEIMFSYSAYYLIDESSKPIGINVENRLRYRDLVFNRNRGCPAFLYRREVHDELGYYNVQRRYSGDTEMLSKIFRRYRTGYVLEPTYHYRLHGQQDTVEAERKGAFALEGQEMVNEYWNSEMKGVLRDVIDDIFPRRPRAREDLYFYCVWALAACFYFHMAISSAISLLKACLRLAPPAHLADVLRFYGACLPDPSSPEALREVEAELALNAGIDHDRAKEMAGVLLATMTPYDPNVVIMSLPRFDFTEAFEREPSELFSLLRRRHQVPVLGC